ncbi:DNA replication terminus site-binding protein [Shewanella frigidimarina]|uniref:DNA replication terminus site-binding protein n=1 Tax=Shewanella frigidimarina TaxID=56812 RepID=UPI003D78C887
MSNRVTLNSYILVNHLNLVEALRELANFVCENALLIHMYQLPNLAVGAEDEHPKVIQINQVLNGVDQQSKRFLKQSITQIEIQAFEENTYLAKRYPGVVVLPQHLKQSFSLLNDAVNKLRSDFYDSVKVGFNNRQSVHENLHELLPNIVLLSATRNVRYLECDADEVSSVNFYWLIKKMVSHVKHDVAEKIINDGVDKIRNSDCFGLTRDELIERREKELELISRVPRSSKIVEVRYARVQPFIDVWTRNEDDSRNRRAIGVNASLPIILFKQPNKIYPLKDYYYKAPKPIDLPTLISRKNWFVK